MATPVARVARIAAGRADLELLNDAAERSGWHEGDELFVFAPGGGVMLLAREAGKRGFLVGDLDALSLSEILGFVTSTIRTGTLVLQSPGVRRRMLFRDGQAVFASSTEPSERLGPVLWRAGLIGAEQLQECEPRVGPGKRLGKVLVEAGFVTSAQLYRGMQLQVREIVLAAFVERSGDFAFIEGESAELNTVKLPERTRDLALEGMGRMQRMEALRQKFDLQAIPRPLEGEALPSGREQEALLARLDGSTTLAKAVRTSRLGEFAAFEALEALVAVGRIDPGPPPAPPPSVARRTVTPVQCGGPLQIYRDSIRRIAEELREAGGASGTGLAGYAESLSPQFRSLFAGVSIDPSGELDLEMLVANAQKQRRGPMGRAMALEALDAFVSFALFEARNVLPEARAVELSREITRMLRGR